MELHVDKQYELNTSAKKIQTHCFGDGFLVPPSFLRGYYPAFSVQIHIGILSLCSSVQLGYQIFHNTCRYRGAFQGSGGVIKSPTWLIVARDKKIVKMSIMTHYMLWRDLHFV